MTESNRGKIHVITDGDSLPVSSSSCTSEIARSARLFKTTGAAFSWFALSFSYFSRYIRIVAPADPVPLRRKTTRAASPLAYSKLKTNPWLLVIDPSTGSVYLKRKEKKQRVNHGSLQTTYLAIPSTYSNSSAATSFIPEGCSLSIERSPPTNSFRIRSIIVFAASLSTA